MKCYVKNKNFFKGASLRLKYKGRELSEKEEKLIVQAFEQIGEMDVIDIGKEIEVSHSDEGNSFRGMAYGLFDPEDGERPAKRSRGISLISEGTTAYYKGSLKKGQRIVYKGSVIIVGNVERGSEIFAGENIIVLGSIKGRVYAGGKTLKTGVIICEQFDAEDFSIAEIKETEDSFYEDLKYFKTGLFSKKNVEMKVLSLRESRITGKS